MSAYGGRKAPVGTQNFWPSTGRTMIKTHDNSVFDGTCTPWIALPETEEHWLMVLKELDFKARYIKGYKEPVDGELWLDRELIEFKTRTGKTFTPAQLKAYSGGDSYSFTEEIIKRREYNRIKLQSDTAEALLEANEVAKYRKSGAGEVFDDSIAIFLTDDEIKEIKKKVKEEYKDDSTKLVVKEDVDDIRTMLQGILDYLEKGENFDGDQAAVYAKGKAFLDELRYGPYYKSDSKKLDKLKKELFEEWGFGSVETLGKTDSITNPKLKELVTEVRKLSGSSSTDTSGILPMARVRTDMKNMLNEMDTAFKDAWGVRESYRKRLEEAFSTFINRFRKEIEVDELETFKKVTGADLYSPTEVFYTALENSPLFQQIDVSSYIGKMVPHPENKYKDVLFVAYEDGQMYFKDDAARAKKIRDWSDGGETRVADSKSEQSIHVTLDTLQSLIAQREIGSELEVPLKLRFSKLYEKNLQGDFNRGDLTLLKITEKMFHYLPAGHMLTNRHLGTFRKQTYFSNSDNSYAHYQGGKNEIYISNQVAKSSQLGITDLHSGEEVASIMIHEVGHAVSQKLGRRDSMEYKKFVVQCGWTWESFQLGNKNTNYIATGDQDDLKRMGSHSAVPLMTAYSGKSPEEAFAEYYSLYSQYKKPIDKFITTGDKKHLEVHKSVRTDNSPKRFGEHASFRHADDAVMHSEMRAVLANKKRDLGTHIRTGVIDPYLNDLETIKEKNVNTGKIVHYKMKSSKNREVPVPVFSVYDAFTGKQDIPDVDNGKDVGIHFANKYLRRLSPTYSISKECFKILTDSGYSAESIKGFTMNEVYDKRIPTVKDVVSGEIKGLRYRSHFIDANHLEKMSGIFKAMKGIWESEALKKALEEMGLLQTIEEDLLEKGGMGSGRKIGYGKEGPSGDNPYSKGESVTYHRDYAFGKQGSETAKVVSSHPSGKVLLDNGHELHHFELQAAENKHLQGLKKSDNDTTIIEFLKPYVKKIQDKVFGKKHQNYADVVVRNFKGEILLLERAGDDDFMPGKWSLPGGKIEQGENPEQGAVRELEEETGLKCEGTLSSLGVKKKPDCTINYFETIIFEPRLTFLDNEEHYRYQWVKLEDIENYDLLLDLGEYLLDLPLTDMNFKTTDAPLTFEEIVGRKEVGETLFNEGKITTEEYLENKQTLKKSLFGIVEQGFNEGKVSPEKYLKYKESVKV